MLVKGSRASKQLAAMHMQHSLTGTIACGPSTVACKPRKNCRVRLSKLNHMVVLVLRLRLRLRVAVAVTCTVAAITSCKGRQSQKKMRDTGKSGWVDGRKPKAAFSDFR
jgi:hypothetical protein